MFFGIGGKGTCQINEKKKKKFFLFFCYDSPILNNNFIVSELKIKLDMPPKSKMSQKRQNKKTKNHEALENKSTKVGDSSKMKCGANFCDKISPLRIIKNHNIVNNLFNIQNGNENTRFLHKAGCDALLRNISSMVLYKNECPFIRRLTAIEWHPKRPRTLVFASKGGEILIWNYETPLDVQPMIPGPGAGAGIHCVRFNPFKDMELLTTSVEGKVAIWDYVTRTCTVCLKAENYDRWYTGLGVSPTGREFFVGDTNGNGSLLTITGKEIWKKRLHRNKISHAEFNKRQPWLLVTTSIDRTVKLWDVRKLEDKNSALSVLHHDMGVNSAYFSLTDATRLLTTDQHSQLRVYRGPLWELERIISHPHRQFQHITPIRATWHPLEDIVVVGRYPDLKFPGYEDGEMRTVDFIDAETGDYRYRLVDQSIKGIMSLNHFNNTGDALATAMGVHLLIWRPNPDRDLTSVYKDKPRKLSIQEKKSKFSKAGPSC